MGKNNIWLCICKIKNSIQWGLLHWPLNTLIKVKEPIYFKYSGTWNKWLGVHKMKIIVFTSFPFLQWGDVPFSTVRLCFFLRLFLGQLHNSFNTIFIKDDGLLDGLPADIIDDLIADFKAEITVGGHTALEKYRSPLMATI